MPKVTIYTLVIEDNVPEIRELHDVGTLSMQGLNYWLVPIPVERVEPPAPIKKAVPVDAINSEDRDEVLRLLDEGIHSIESMSRQTRLTSNEIRRVIHDAGLKTPAELLQKTFADALLDAGEHGLAPQALGKMAAAKGQRAGPIIQVMLRRKEVKRLANGYWVIAT
jgi:hypothetical protein